MTPIFNKYLHFGYNVVSLYLVGVCNISKPILIIALLCYIYYACTMLLMLFACAQDDGANI